jgi:hypothetical protein
MRRRRKHPDAGDESNQRKYFHPIMFPSMRYAPMFAVAGVQHKRRLCKPSK